LPAGTPRPASEQESWIDDVLEVNRQIEGLRDISIAHGSSGVTSRSCTGIATLRRRSMPPSSP
jgi:hypothetical protein